MTDGFAALRQSLKTGETAPWPAEAASAVPSGSIFDVLQIQPSRVGPGAAVAHMRIGPQHLNQRGFCQGGAIVALADATAGWATYCLVPEGQRFTTLQLQTNFLGGCRAGDLLVATAAPVHAGRTTVVLTVDVGRLDVGRLDSPDEATATRCAYFTCTQVILPAKP